MIRNNGNTFTSSGVQSFGSAATLSAIPSSLQGNFVQFNRLRNRYMGQAGIYAKSGFPSGYRHPAAWSMPQKGGALASRNTTSFTITPSGSGALGAPIDGSAAITITATGTGGLITSGSGSADMSITATGSILATVSTSGDASFAITTNSPLLGALAFVDGNTTITFSGSLTAYGLGFMTGSTVDSTVLTIDNIAAGVLAASTSSPIYADIRKVNGYTVTGNGQTGAEWGPL